MAHLGTPLVEEWDAKVPLDEWDAVLFQAIVVDSVGPLKKRLAWAPGGYTSLSGPSER